MQQDLGITSLPLVSNFLFARNRDGDRDLLIGDPSNTGIHYGIDLGMGNLHAYNTAGRWMSCFYEV